MMTTRPRATIGDIRIRPLIDTAVCDVEEIEALAFASSFYAAWGLEEIHAAAHANAPGYRCFIARAELGHSEDVLGWIFFRRTQYSTTVLRIATHPSSWGRGIGRMMIQAVASDLPITIWLDEADEETPKFLRCVGFKRGGLRYSDGITRIAFLRSPDGS